MARVKCTDTLQDRQIFSAAQQILFCPVFLKSLSFWYFDVLCLYVATLEKVQISDMGALLS
jgi:hypothetical protein